jgi:quercetin dioxygenase-like cupin family protein
MKTLTKVLVVSAVVLAVSLGAWTQAKSTAKSSKPAATAPATKSTAPAMPASSEMKMYAPDKIQWGPGPAAMPPGAQAAVLEGDPTKPGIFTMRVKFPNNYKLPPHFHPRRERTTIISGSVRVGSGDVFNEAGMMELGPGSYITIEPNTHHFAMVKNSNLFKGHDTVVQITGEGPWELHYVNASDDPRKKK